MDYYYFPNSHWSRAISLVIEEKGLEPERHLVDIRRNASFEPDYLALNPRGVVPTVVDDGEAIWDSLRIAAHLDTVGGPPLYRGQSNPQVDERVEQLEAFPLMLFSYEVWVKGRRGERSADILADKVSRAARYAERFPALAEAYRRKERFFRDFRAQVYDPSHLAEQKAQRREQLDDLGRLLLEQTWLGGERYCFADCIATSILYRLVDLGELDHWSRDSQHGLHGYYQRLRERPSFAAVFRDDPLIC
jgi:glutathione S-transferase